MTKIDSSSAYSPLPPAVTELNPLYPAEHVPPADTLGVNEASAADAWSPSRPQLTRPSELPSSDRRILDVAIETQGLGNEIMTTSALRLKNIKLQIKEYSAENMQKLKEASEKAKSSNFWSFLKKIATALASAMSIIFGIGLMATGGGALIGGAMIASGVLSLANFAMSEAEGWDWVAKQLASENEDCRRNLMMILPTAVGILAAGMGLAGSIYSIASGAVAFMDKALFIAQAALGVFQGVTIFGQGMSQAQLLWAQSDLMRLGGHITAERTDFDSAMRELESGIRDMSAIKSKTKKIVQTITQSNVQVVRQG